MSTKAIQCVCCVVLAIAAMFGLHFGVEYSGWVLFVALLGVFAT